MLTFEEYKAQRDQLSNWYREIGAELSAYPKNEMGMTIESIRNTPEYKEKRALCNKVFQQLRTLNGKYIKLYKKELADERKLKRSVK
ncbi:hypothetical protein [Brucella melitensis]|uniref:hypothetical protein n=1 Tax=Brucella melitensis TaxID=29459 RepID=UPI0032C0D046